MWDNIKKVILQKNAANTFFFFIFVYVRPTLSPKHFHVVRDQEHFVGHGRLQYGWHLPGPRLVVIGHLYREILQTKVKPVEGRDPGNRFPPLYTFPQANLLRQVPAGGVLATDIPDSRVLWPQSEWLPFVVEWEANKTSHSNVQSVKARIIDRIVVADYGGSKLDSSSGTWAKLPQLNGTPKLKSLVMKDLLIRLSSLASSKHSRNLIARL